MNIKELQKAVHENAVKHGWWENPPTIGELLIERINEMATRVIKLEGDDFRSIARDEKSEIAKKLGI